MASTKQLVLASTSLYRKKLMQKLHLDFETAAPNIDETPYIDETPEQLVIRLSQAKALALQHQFPNALIIGSDQIAVVDGKILGKPGDHASALQQLQYTSGKRVTFLTGLCVFNSFSEQCHISTDTTIATFRTLDSDALERYLFLEKPYDCAGSFKSEGYGICLLESIETQDPNALIGLPLIHLVRLLQREAVCVP